MHNLSIKLLVYFSCGLSFLIIAWALLVRLRLKDFKLDIPKIFVTSSIKSFRTSCITVLYLLVLFLLTTLYRTTSINSFFEYENLLLMVPIVLSFIVIYIMEPLSRK